TLVSGFSFINGQGSNYGMGMLRLKKLSERKGEGSSIQTVIGKLFGIAAQMPDSKTIFFSPPSVPGYGFSSGFELKLLDKSGGSLAEFNDVANQYLKQLTQRPEIMYAQTSFDTSYAQYEIELNVPRAKQSGVSVNNIFSALQGYI